jgi:hypothetical protein
MSEGRGRSLTRREFDAVIRRAAELAASDGEAAEGALSEADVFRIAGEVGLSEAHVRRALSDVRSGADDPGLVTRLFGPTLVSAARIVPGRPEAIAAEIDDFLVASQLLQPVRRGVGVLQYRPALDWASQLARAASFTSRKYYVASAKSVEVRLEAVDEKRTLVDVRVDPGTRNDDVGAAVVGGGIGGGAAGAFTAWGLATLIPLSPAITLGALVGAGVWSAIAYLTGQAHKKKLLEVTTEIEGVLDALETGDSLEPPPASWRRWVKRQFHGVAQDMRRAEDEIGM